MLKDDFLKPAERKSATFTFRGHSVTVRTLLGSEVDAFYKHLNDNNLTGAKYYNAALIAASCFDANGNRIAGPEDIATIADNFSDAETKLILNKNIEVDNLLGDGVQEKKESPKTKVTGLRSNSR